MGKIYFKENYNAVLEALHNKLFYIFGNTLYAQMFYLFCMERGVSKNIQGFILSDISKLKDKRKRHKLHGLPIKDVIWLAQTDRECSIFLAAREMVIRGQLITMLEDMLDADLYYVSEFVNTMMFHHYMASAYDNIIIRYRIMSNPYESISFLITDKKENDYYNYTPRVVQGVLPDVNIFGKNEKLNEIHYRQLKHYRYIDNNCKSSQEGRKCRCKIYQTRSHFDQKLKEDYYTPFTEVIQAGAELTDIEIAQLKDNEGENLSLRNQDYCEMSAVYWIWKNDKESDYIGLCHYRRRFVVDEDMIDYIMSEGYDAVYTIPQLIDGGLRDEFVERNYFLTPEIWDITENVIRKLSPGYLEAWEQLQTSYFLLPYNMFIMRRDIFEDYCAWVFSVLKEVDRYYLEQGIQRNDRYLGYIAELLNTVYAMKHVKTLKKGYVHMKMLESE